MAVKSYKGPDDKFVDACKSAGIPATKRQYKKYQKQRGKAYAAREL